ncbi:S-adenosyl-L-methionine-dependent methyltransferase [Delphinella strobiligena]|nr:S-adenosyl-L-methionine-dependent methyltransferase [Delphinella strobiligena]
MSDSSAPKGIDSPPAPGQLIEHNGITYTTIKEGLAHILVPPNARTEQDTKGSKKGEDGAGEVQQSVFYNPIQQFNRDLSVLAIKAFGEDVCARRRQKSQQNRAKRDKKRQTKDRDGDAKSVPASTTNGTSATVEENGHAEVQTNEYIPKFRILDALSATGLRALRYAKEITFATSVVSNDMSEAAVASIALNVRHNNLTSKIQPSTGNAIGHMYQAAYATPGSSTEAWAQGKYDVVDLDPYGTAVPFLDAATQCLNDGGMLCVTCTDAGVFASCGYVEKTFSLYGGLPIKGPHSHEAGLRLILYSIATAAGKYGIAIEPLLSLSIDYYARVFVRAKKSPADVKFLSGKTMLVHQCDGGCGAWQTQYLARHTAQAGRTNFKHAAAQSTSDKNCPHCGFKTHVAGPMWGGPIHNPYFIKRILDSLPKADKETYQTTQRIEGMLTSALDELDVLPPTALTVKDTERESPLIPALPHHAQDPHPFFFIPSNLAKILHCQAPSEAAVKGALRKAGFAATRSHCKPGTIKTQASWEMVWEIMREWVRQKAPIKEGKVREKMSGWKILQEEKTKTAEEEEKTKKAEEDSKKVATSPSRARRGSFVAEDVKKIKIVFDEKLGKDNPGKKLTRYQVNPRDNWGPMSRAKGHS